MIRWWPALPNGLRIVLNALSPRFGISILSSVWEEETRASEPTANQTGHQEPTATLRSLSGASSRFLHVAPRGTRCS
jgi:hypothetical protein